MINNKFINHCAFLSDFITMNPNNLLQKLHFEVLEFINKEALFNLLNSFVYLQQLSISINCFRLIFNY